MYYRDSGSYYYIWLSSLLDDCWIGGALPIYYADSRDQNDPVVAGTAPHHTVAVYILDLHPHGYVYGLLTHTFTTPYARTGYHTGYYRAHLVYTRTPHHCRLGSGSHWVYHLPAILPLFPHGPHTTAICTYTAHARVCAHTATLCRHPAIRCASYIYRYCYLRLPPLRTAGSTRSHLRAVLHTAPFYLHFPAAPLPHTQRVLPTTVHVTATYGSGSLILDDVYTIAVIYSGDNCAPGDVRTFMTPPPPERPLPWWVRYS